MAKNENMRRMLLPKNYLALSKEIRRSDSYLQNIAITLLEHNKKLSKHLKIATREREQFMCLYCKCFGALMHVLSQNEEQHPPDSCWYMGQKLFQSLSIILVVCKQVTMLSKCHLHGNECELFAKLFPDVLKFMPMFEKAKESLSNIFTQIQEKDDQSKAYKREKKSYVLNGNYNRKAKQKKKKDSIETTGDQYNARKMGKKSNVLNGLPKSENLRNNKYSTDISDDESGVAETQKKCNVLNGNSERSINQEKHNDSTDKSDDESDADKKSSFLNSMSRRNKYQKKNKDSVDSSAKKTTTKLIKRKNKSDAPSEIKKSKYSVDSSSKSLYRSRQTYSPKIIKNGVKRLISGNSSDLPLSDVNDKKSSVKPRQKKVKAEEMVESVSQMTGRKKLKNNKILESANIKVADQSPMSVNNVSDCKSVRKSLVVLTNVLNDPAAAKYPDVSNLLKYLEEKKRKDIEEKKRKDIEEKKRKYIEEKKRKDIEEKKRKDIEEKKRKDTEEKKRKDTEEKIKKDNEEKKRKYNEENKRKAIKENKRKYNEENKRKAIKENKRKAAKEKKRGAIEENIKSDEDAYDAEDAVMMVVDDADEVVDDAVEVVDDADEVVDDADEVVEDADEVVEDADEVIDDADESSTNNSDNDNKSKLEDSETYVHKESSNTHDSVNCEDDSNSESHLSREMDEEQDRTSLRCSVDEKGNYLISHKAEPSLSESSTGPSSGSSGGPSTENLIINPSTYGKKGPQTPPLPQDSYRRGPRTPPGKAPDSDGSEEQDNCLLHIKDTEESIM